MPDNIPIQFYKSPIGELILGSYKGKLCLCDWSYRKLRKVINHRICTNLKAELIEVRTETHEKATTQLNEYFQGERKEFDLPILMIGTEFQKQVWTELMNIPYGRTSSYLALSQRLGNEKAIRAVATANGANALAIIIPCHRVIGQDGGLVGYAGGLPAKQSLLELEKSIKTNQLTLF